MSTLRISNIEAKSVPASATVDEKVKITNSSGDTLVFIDGKTSGITTVGINTTDSNITFDANSNVVVTGIITATRFSGQITPTSLEIGSNIKLGNAGVITATSFVGSGANLTSLPSQVTIANNADNRVITGGSGVNLNGEANVQIDSSGRLSVGNSQASTQYSGSNDLVIGNTTGDHGITIISNTNNRGRLMFSRTYSADTQRYDGQILYDHQTTTMNFYSNYTNNQAVAMQLGGSENQLFVGIDKGNTTTFGNRSAYFHRATDNYISITGSGTAGIVFGDTIANNAGNYETYMHHTNSTNDFWIRVNQGNDNRHLKITQAGNVEIGNGNLVMANGHGIDFSATANSTGSVDNELLKDYEEGTFTPYVRTNNNSTEPSYSHRVGLYTRVGRLVTYMIRITTSGELSTGSGATEIWGLPFNAMNWNVGDWPGHGEIAYYSNLRGNYGTNPRLLGPYNNANYIRFHLLNAQTDTGNNRYNHVFTNNTVMIISGQYFTG